MKRFVAIFFLYLGILACYAQDTVEQPKPSISERFYFGGGLGFNTGRDAFGNRYTFFAVNPIIGYNATQQLSIGSGINYQVMSFPEVNVTLHQYGVSPFVRYNLGQLFLFGEYNVLSTPLFAANERRTFDRLLLGVGYTQPIGQRGAVNAVALYDVLYDQTERVFASPWVFRVFFTF